MKKIRCDMVPSDWIKVGIARDTIDPEDIIIEVKSSEDVCIRLNPDKIRKLRKQLKRALNEIEGKPDDSIGKTEYNPGDSVYMIEGDGEGTNWSMSPTVTYIDISKPVTLNHRNEKGEWSLTYTLLDGSDNIGYAYEKSFGLQA